MLELKMRGYPRPNIKWCKDGKPLTVDNSRFKFINPDTETVALIINKVTADDAGKYEAVLTNDLGEAKTEGTLTLSGAPQFMEPIGDQNTAIDDPYKIVAKVTGNPELTWYKDGIPINQDTRLKANKVSVVIRSQMKNIHSNVAKRFGFSMRNYKNTNTLVDLGQRGHVRAELCPGDGRRQRKLGGDREERTWRDVSVL